MPFIDLPGRSLRQYYTINPTYTDDNLDMTLNEPPPPSREEIDPNKPTLVFVHAGTSSSHSFIYQFRDPRLSASLNLVGFDSRYYGRTGGDKLDHYQDLDERADEMLDAIDAVVGDRPFSYFGESFVGSHVGAYIAAKRPEQVKALILVSPSFIEDPPEMCEVLETQWAPLTAQNKFGNGDGTGRLPEEAMAIVRDYFFSGSQANMDKQERFLEQYQYHHGYGKDMFEVNQLLHWFRRRAPPADVWEAIRCPVMLLGGTNDTTVNPADALGQWYEALVNVPAEDKRVERIVDGSHFLATTDANLVNRFTYQFLKRYNLA
ncbi:hypothetical protein JCM8097_006461 [Rhodosporidiobolus ruineniae]